MKNSIIHISRSEIDSDNGEPPKDERCPKCGATINHGFGNAYGGYGPYSSCDLYCGWFHKVMVDE